jgi:hypothetical protein
MVVVAGGKEDHAARSRLVPHVLRHPQTEHLGIEADGPVQVGDPEMHVADLCCGMDRSAVHDAFFSVGVGADKCDVVFAAGGEERRHVGWAGRHRPR